MARETKTVQCYPDDSIINERIKQYEAFGWELINNQRCQEYEGQTFTYDTDGSRTATNHYSTFNKLTFSREKSSPWYGEVTELENKYNNLMSSKPQDYSIAPSNKLLGYGIPIIIIGICVILFNLSIGATALLIAGAAIIGLGVILVAVYIVKKKKCSSAHSNYLTRLSAWRSTTEAEAKKVMQQAEALVNGN